MPHFTTDVYLHTNTSIYKIPLYAYHGRLKVSGLYCVYVYENVEFSHIFNQSSKIININCLV